MRELLFLSIANHLPRMKVFDDYRYLLLKLAGIEIGGRCQVWGPLTIRPIGGAKNIKIGKGSFLNTEIRFGVPDASVTIGENVQIGPRVLFETVDHGLVFKPNEGRGAWSKPIVVQDEVWVGAGAIITQGVTIGRGAVVAAGSVVNKDVDAHTVVGGVPAKFLRPTEARTPEPSASSPPRLD